MKIVHSDGEDSTSTAGQELSCEKELQQPEDTSTRGILSSGWGAFLAVAGVISVVMDISSPSVKTNVGPVQIFAPGSLTLGWLFITGAFVLPPVILRQFCKRACHPVVAFIWCVLLFLAWAVVHQSSDPYHPARPNLALFGGIVLCWRLLTKKQPPKQETVEDGLEGSARVPEDVVQVKILPRLDGRDEPKKIGSSPPKERFIRQPARVEIPSQNQPISNIRKKIIGAGVLIISIASMIRAAYRYAGTPSLAWMVALSATWALIVWLWPERFNQPKIFTAAKTTMKWLSLALIVAWAAQFGIYEAYHSKLAVDFHQQKNQIESEMKILKEQKEDAVKDIRNIVAACITLREAKAEHEILNAAIELRQVMERQRESR